MNNRFVGPAIVCLTGAWCVLAGGAAGQVAGVTLSAIQVADSQSYFVYEYEFSNSASSTWSVAGLRLHLPASAGTPEYLPATGSVRVLSPYDTVAPRAEVGPIAPSGWTSILSPLARLRWAPPNTRSASADSVAPGTSKSGFGIRSSYLPAIGQVEAFPTVESCCRQPSDTTGGERIYDRPDDHAALGDAVVPRYMPSEVDIDVVQAQLSTICDDPLWLSDSSLCAEFDRLLADAEDDYEGGEYTGAAATLDHLLDRIGSEQAAFDTNGYWLIYRNVEQAYENVLAQARAAAG